MMNQEVFLGILKSFIHPEEKLPKTRRLEAEDWEEIFHAAAEHAVLPIIYEAAWKKNSFQKVPQQIRAVWKSRIKRQIALQIQITDLFLDLYRRITSLGVTPLVMKGIVCRNMYSLSDHRISSDEDMLVEREKMPKLDRILTQCGFQRELVEDFKKVHEITYYHPSNGLRLEVHLSLFPEESGSYGRLNEEFPRIFERQVKLNIQGVEIHTMDPTQHMLYLLCHALKHFLHSGFGIRQLCDMVLFAETYGTEIDWIEIEKRTKDQNMYIFWMNLFDIGEKYLGFSWEKAGISRPDSRMLHSKELLAELLDSGIYGKSSEERLHSAAITLNAADRRSKKKSGIITALFPNIVYMKRTYPYLEKYRWMLPAAWLQRMVTYKKQTSRKNFMKPVETGKQRVKLLEKYGIIEK